MLEVHQLTKKYGELSILKDVSFSVQKGSIISIIGSSGAGKTTLLQILGTLDKPSSGSFMFDGINPFTLNQQQLAQFRNKNIGFVFQFHQLLPEFTALENIMIPAMIGGDTKKQAQQKGLSLLEQVGLTGRASHKPNELSGGEQQRIAVCRALVNQPKIVLADEPSGNLDSRNADELHDLFFSLREKLAQTFIIVTHNPILAQRADRTITLQDGVIVWIQPN